MPICITCSTPVKNLYTTYSKADDRSLGKGVRLTQCPNCKRFADKYVEHDYVVLFIDLVLIKPQVYRHLLFNRLYSATNTLDPSIVRLGILLVLFDVYITWARIEQSNNPQTQKSGFGTAPIITQYLFFLTLNVVATLVQHGSIRMLARVLVGEGKAVGHERSSSSMSNSARNVLSVSTSALDEAAARTSPVVSDGQQVGIQLPLPPKIESVNATGPGGHASPSAISTALLVSSCTKLFPILLVIWPTTGSSQSPSTAPLANRATSYIGWVVLLNNIEALLILLDCGYVVASALAVTGFLSRWVVEGWLLHFVGLVREMEGPAGDVISIWRWVIGGR